MTWAYYNEIDPYCVEWLRNLMLVGLIAPGEVDSRSIVDVYPDELRGFKQCHFFAGLGAWSYALRLAGWSDERECWTGSCPCQPFSSAGRAGGFADERHLWPHFFHLIEHGKPRSVPVFGEQVASKDGLAWLDLVHADLEGAGYTVGAVDSCAAGVGAPHIRQRLYWAAHRQGERCGEAGDEHSGRPAPRISARGESGSLADSDQERHPGTAEGAESTRRSMSTNGCGLSRLGHHHPRSQGHGGDGDRGDEPGRVDAVEARPVGAAGPVGGFWSDVDWLPCRDGKARPVEPGTFPLAHGAVARVGRLRAYGNAIVAPQAAEFVRAVMTCRP